MKKSLLFIMIFIVTAVMAQEKVILQLPWLNQFQFAGYYIAKEKGFYADAGLDVEIRDAQFKQLPVESVVSGKAQFGVGRSSLLIDYAKGEPIVMMAAIFQSSPMMLLVREDSGIKSTYDLRGKRVMLTNDTIEGAELQAMFRSVGLSSKDLKIIPHTYDPLSLERNETDAMVAYLSNEPYILKKHGIKTIAFHPKDYGFDFYSDILFTSNQMLKEHPEKVNAFYEASIRGWLWAFEHIEETARLIQKSYNPQNKTLEALIYEGQILKQLAFNSGAAFGHIDMTRLEMITQGYRLMGVFSGRIKLDSIVYKHTSLALSDEEKAWLELHPVIQVGIDSNWPPIEFTDSNGKHAGVSASYLQILEKRLGIKFEVNYGYQSWNDAYKALAQGRLDMLSCVAITPQREKEIKFSQPYMKQSIVIVADSGVGFVKDLDDLNGKKVAIVRSYATEEFLRKSHPLIRPVFVETANEALQKVQSGKAYAAIEALSIVSYLIERNNLKGLKIVGETEFEYDLAFGFRNDYEILASITDKVFASLSPSEYQQIHGQWLEMENSKPFDYRYLWAAVIFVTMVLAMSAYKNRRLDVMVRQRTSELEAMTSGLKEEVNKAVEKNRAQEKILMQQAKMAEIGSMLESIAHQWRQPLNILGLTMTRLNMSCTMGLGGEPTKFLEIAENQIQYMSQTIDDFRNFFKQDKERIQSNLSIIIDDVETLLGPLLAHKKIAIEKSIPKNVQLYIYPNELKQVIINIINNAREAIEQSKNDIRLIKISCAIDQMTCTISVEDSGGGIPDKIMDKIFDPYFTTKFESQGTGIGLYMAKMIIEKHFLGELSAKNINNGARFDIKIPHLNEESIKAQVGGENA